MHLDLALACFMHHGTLYITILPIAQALRCTHKIFIPRRYTAPFC